MRLIALGLTLIFGTLGVVNFAHGALVDDRGVLRRHIEQSVRSALRPSIRQKWIFWAIRPRSKPRIWNIGSAQVRPLG